MRLLSDEQYKTIMHELADTLAAKIQAVLPGVTEQEMTLTAFSIATDFATGWKQAAEPSLQPADWLAFMQAMGTR